MVVSKGRLVVLLLLQLVLILLLVHRPESFIILTLACSWVLVVDYLLLSWVVLRGEPDLLEKRIVVKNVHF